jgi:hypothetical protein
MLGRVAFMSNGGVDIHMGAVAARRVADVANPSVCFFREI